MKKLLLSLFTIISFLTFSQITTLLSPTGDGGFETNTAFSTNGWSTVVSGTRTWQVGNAGTTYAGSRAAYVGTTATANGINAAATHHFYRDVTIPAGATNIAFSFYYLQPSVDNGYDYMYVNYTTTANTPVSGTVPGAGYTNLFTNTATAYTTFTLMSYTLPNSLAGTTVRLVFTWKSDGVTPHRYPVVDNINLQYGTAATPPSCVTPTSPSNGATGIATSSQTLSWGTDATATGYDVYFGTNSSPPLVSTNQAGTTYATGALTGGTTYYWKIVPRNGAGSATGCSTWSFTTISPPVNDLCSSPTSLPCGTSNLAGTTVNATLKTAPGGGGLASNYGVWYTFTGDGGQTTVSTTGSGFDNEMTIVQGTCASNTLISSQDNVGGNGTETYTFTTTNGATYYVYVAYWSSAGAASNTGAFTISRSCIAPCTTPTTAGTLSANKTTTTVNDAVIFTTTGNGGTITKFEWSYNNFTTVAGTTNNPANPYTLILNVQQPTMWFRTTSVSGTCPAGVTTPISVTLQSAPPYVYGTSSGDYISNVTLNTINNNSTYDTPVGDSYQDFTSISTTLVRGSTYTISASSTMTFSNYSGYAAWIDFNNNGIFEVSETIMQKGPGATQSQSFTVPSDATISMVTMRVLSSWLETPSTDAYLTGGYDWGEIEEYRINITSALPVEISKFDGLNKGQDNYLFWVTATEHNTSHFNLQKSRDGETWETIVTLNASGNSTTPIDYDVIDYKVDPIINYYRLQQYDNDGVYETFGPITINNMDLNPQKTIIRYINLNGQEINPENLGFMDVYLEIYNDGTIRKVIK